MMNDTHTIAKDVQPLAPAEVDFMPPLLKSLSVLIRLRGKHVSPQFLMAPPTNLICFWRHKKKILIRNLIKLAKLLGLFYLRLSRILFPVYESVLGDMKDFASLFLRQASVHSCSGQGNS